MLIRDGERKTLQVKLQLQQNDEQAAAGNGQTRVVWKSRFKRLAYWTDDPPEGQDDATPVNALNKVYPLGLQTLKKVVEEAR